ncbi:NADH-quinone oxidoreductase subunit M, partial [Streptomyces sp. 900116325]
MNGFPWLTALWLLPLAGALAAAALPARRKTAVRWLALVAGFATLAIAVVLAVRFEPAGERYQFVESHSWIPAFGTRYELGLDGIALALVLLTAILVPLLLLAGWRDVPADDARPRGTHAYVALILVVESMVLMSFLALDILLFYVLFEAMLIPMYFLIGGYGQPGP